MGISLQRSFRPGDAVIFRLAKISNRPGPRAIEIRPSRSGDSYSYLVEKIWKVASVLDDGKLELETRTGKRYVVASDAPQLRRPSLLDRWRYRDRYPFFAA